QEAVRRSDTGAPRMAAEGRRGMPADRPAPAGPAAGGRAGPAPAAGSGSVRSAGTGTAVGAGRNAGRAQAAGPAAGRDGRPHRRCRPQGSALEWAVRSRGDGPAASVLTET